MKLITLINARNLVESFADKDDLNAHLAYWMTKFIVATQTDADFYFSEVRKIIEKYGKIKEDGAIDIPEEKGDQCNKELLDLQNMEVEAPNIKFALSELAAELKLSMRQAYQLMNFIDEEK